MATTLRDAANQHLQRAARATRTRLPLAAVAAAAAKQQTAMQLASNDEWRLCVRRTDTEPACACGVPAPTWDCAVWYTLDPRRRRDAATTEPFRWGMPTDVRLCQPAEKDAALNAVCAVELPAKMRATTIIPAYLKYQMETKAARKEKRWKPEPQHRGARAHARRYDRYDAYEDDCQSDSDSSPWPWTNVPDDKEVEAYYSSTFNENDEFNDNENDTDRSDTPDNCWWADAVTPEPDVIEFVAHDDEPDALVRPDEPEPEIDALPAVPLTADTDDTIVPPEHAPLLSCITQ